jgi:16S rRNA (guanine527-N7)-methyltransferase
MAGILTPEAFQAETGVSRETLARLEAYAALLRKWNKAINLVAAGSLEDLWRRHLLDSAQLMDHLPPESQGRRRVVVDLGSGAGFPGLVLSILGAGEVHLVESDQRKCVFLREAARVTLAHSLVHNSRIEDLAPFPADLVTARALAPLKDLIGHATAFLPSGGCALFLKGKAAKSEVVEAAAERSFTVQSFPSRTDPTGAVLAIGIPRP